MNCSPLLASTTKWMRVEMEVCVWDLNASRSPGLWQLRVQPQDVAGVRDRDKLSSLGPV